MKKEESSAGAKFNSTKITRMKTVILLQWKIFILWSFFVSACCEDGVTRVLNFQARNVPTTNSSAALTLNPSSDARGPMTSLSVCVWIQVHYFKPPGSSYVFSYATSDKKNNQLNLGIHFNFVVIAIAEKYRSFAKEDHFWPRLWYHICMTAKSKGEVRAYVNGVLLGRASRKRFEIPLNGSFVLGQETDELHGGFNAFQSFSGRVTNLNLYSRELSAEEIKVASSCRELKRVSGDIIDWHSVKLDVKEAEVEWEKEEVLCRNTTSVFRLFVESVPYKGASQLCKNVLKSSLYLPGSAEENRLLYNGSSVFVDICKSKSHSTGYLWLGIQEKEGQWVDMQMHPPNFTNFQSNSNVRNQNCALLEGYPSAGGWNDVKCHRHSACLACHEKEPAVFTLRGICAEKKLETLFVLGPLINSSKYYFQGITRYEIHQLADRRTWSLRDMWTQTAVASYFAADGSYPVGTRNWTIDEDYVLCDKPAVVWNAPVKERKKDLLVDGIPHLMTLSACAPDEYTCAGGSCVPLGKRCNLVVDCEDSSDETHCGKLSLPQGYLRALPPPGAQGAPALGVAVEVVIRTISEVDHKNMLLTIDLTLSLTWNDLRLAFSNLKLIEALNYIDESNVWLPAVEYQNADFPQIHKSSPALVAFRSASPEEDDLVRPVRDEIFLGEKIQLKLTQRIKAPFACHMDLSNFPFDIQTCWIRIKELHGNSLVQWESLHVHYAGETLLTEFQVRPIVGKIATEDNCSLALIRIKMERRFSYYVTSAYLPTLMLMVISYASLFCKIENVDLRVMMTITILIVLYTLYQQISDGLPKTSYAKAIDVWCFFALFMIFTQIVFHVVLEIDVKVLSSCSRKKIMKRREETEDKPPRPSEKILYLHCARACYIIMFIMFCVAHFTIIIVNFKSSS